MSAGSPRRRRGSASSSSSGGTRGRGLVVAGISFYVTLMLQRRSNQVASPISAAGPRPRPPRRRARSISRSRSSSSVTTTAFRAANRPAGAPADTPVMRGRKVRLVMSLGGEVLRIPTLVGEAERKVEIELRQEGLVPGRPRPFPREARRGLVMARCPRRKPGDPRDAGPSPRSSGPTPPRWVMPDLAGAACARGAVDRGIRPPQGAVRRIEASRPPGTVIGQLPLAGFPCRHAT